MYVTELLQPFIAQLTEEELNKRIIRQYGATAHTSVFSMSYIHENFREEHRVSTVL